MEQGIVGGAGGGRGHGSLGVELEIIVDEGLRPLLSGSDTAVAMAGWVCGEEGERR